MTEQERQRRLNELEQWLTEICNDLRDEAALRASDAACERHADRVWEKLSEGLDVAAKVFAGLCKKSSEYLETKLQSKEGLLWYFKGAVKKELHVKTPQELQRSRARLRKLDQNRPLFQREDEAVQRERAETAREIYEKHYLPCRERLSERDRRMLQAKDRDNKTIDEIVAEESISTGKEISAATVKTALSRARHTVREYLIERGVELSDLW